MTASKPGFFKNKLVSGVRNQIQLLIFLVTIAAGFQFYLYVSQITGDGAVTILRPTGVEGFLPIGALMGWKYFLATGIWDNIHPAAMVFLGFAVLVSFLLRRSFCSWFCPVGTLSEWAWKTGESLLGKNFRLPVWVDMPFRGVKYALLGFFAWIILKMSPSDIAGFFDSPYYKIADIKMLLFFTKMSMITAAVLVVLTIMSFLLKISGAGTPALTAPWWGFSAWSARPGSPGTRIPVSIAVNARIFARPIFPWMSKPKSLPRNAPAAWTASRFARPETHLR
jgi:hypothetical protein